MVHVLIFSVSSILKTYVKARIYDENEAIPIILSQNDCYIPFGDNHIPHYIYHDENDLSQLSFSLAGNRPATEESSQSENPQRYTYSVKIFNPNKKSKFCVEKMRKYGTFKSPEELRSALNSEFGSLISDKDDFDVGYIKGRGQSKVWIKDEEDLKCMYDMFSKNAEICLWCEGCNDSYCGNSKKRKNDSVSDKPISKRQAIREEVEEIFATLQEKHGSTFSATQLCFKWALTVIQTILPMCPCLALTPKNAQRTQEMYVKLYQVLLKDS